VIRTAHNPSPLEGRMSRTVRSTFALLFLLATPAAGQPDKPLPKQFLEGARTDALSLLAEVERLQEDIVLDPIAQKSRDLYKLGETALTEIARFERVLKSETNQDILLKHFDTIDADVRKLVAAVRKAAPQGLALQRTADHVNRANEELYFTLAGGATKLAGQVTQRQAHGFTEATRDLERTARYALGNSAADRAVMIDNAAKLAIAAERFEKSLANKGDLKQRQTDFADVDKAWLRIVQDMGQLKPAENVHLLGNAARVDRLHERLYRLLEIKGKRPSLSVQS
jgi:hypothetical protein